MEQRSRVTKPLSKRKRVQSKTDCGALDSSAIFNMSQTITNPSGTGMRPSVSFSSSQDLNPFSVISHQHQPFHFQQQPQPGMTLYPPPPTSFNSPPPWMADLINKIDNLTLKMKSVDDIKSSVISIDSKLTNMKSVVDGLVKRVDDVESSQQFISASFEKNKYDVTSIADEITQLRDVNKNVTYQLEYLQCESLRDNLMFFGVEEEEEGEDCVDIIKNICSSSLEIRDPVGISSAFRMGKKITSSRMKGLNRKPRPIVAKFLIRQQRDTVRKNSPKLKESTISIAEHFPKSIHEKRKLLFPMYKKAKDEGKEASLIKDKLFIDGEQTVVKSNNVRKHARRESDNRSSDTQSGPMSSGANKKTGNPSRSLEQREPPANTSPSTGSRFEVLADVHMNAD